MQIIETKLKRLAYRVWASSILLLAVACDEDWAHRLSNGGAIIPGARTLVVLAEPLPVEDAVDTLSAIAEEAGFPYLARNSAGLRTVHLPDHTREEVSWVWHRKRGDHFGSKSGDYKLQIYGIVEEKLIREFTLIFFNKSTQDFTADEWLYFQRINLDVITKRMNIASLEVTRHPSHFNNCIDLTEISQQTGMVVPDKILAEC